LPASKQWWQRTWFSGGKASEKEIEAFKLEGTNIRAAIDRLTETERAKAIGKADKLGKSKVKGRRTRSVGANSFAARADALRQAIMAVSGKAE
jgi:hypothetical protein